MYYDSLMASDGGRAVAGLGHDGPAHAHLPHVMEARRPVMLVCIPNVLDAGQLVSVRERLDRANVRGSMGASPPATRARRSKFNQQIDERSDVALACQRIVVSALERHPVFISAVLPNVIYPPMFNRYSEGMKFGAHVDGSVRISPHDGRKLRTDVSATLFLTNPDEYDGGELADRGHLRPAQRQARRPATWWSIRPPACTRWRRSRAACARRASSGCRA